MDAFGAVVATGLGAIVGTALGLVPALHPNTSALAAAAVTGHPLGVLAAAAAHTLAGVLPTTFLGAPPEDAALAAMPAHRLLLEGEGRLAHRVALAASLAGLTFGILLVLPMKWVFAAPLGFGGIASAAAPTVIVAATLWLVAREGTWPRRTLALILWLLAGVLALGAMRVPLTAFVDLAPSPFMPMLSGLFAGTGLVLALQGPAQLAQTLDMPRLRLRQRRAVRSGILRGIGASLLATVVPGLTPGIAAVAGRVGAKDDDLREVALVMTINTAQTVLTVAWLFVAGQSRTGITQLLAEDAWTTWERGTPPLALAAGLLALLAGGVVAAWVARLLEPLGLRVATADARVVAGTSLALLVAAVVVLSGAWGLVVFATALALGLTGHAWGVGRLHLAGALSVPFLLRVLGA